MSRGYDFCRMCKHKNGDGYDSCIDCFNGDGFSSEDNEYGYTVHIYEPDQERYINKLYERDTPKKIKIVNNTRYDKYYCPSCNKQQKNTYKNQRKGCYCERCGQRLAPFVQGDKQ